MSATKDNESEGFQDRVVSLSRVAKVVKGGRRFSFSALVIVGDSKGKVGFGLGKAGEVPDAIKKASEHAKKNLMDICHVGGTLPFDVDGKFGSCTVRMYPGKAGKGVIAGGPARTILELGGFKDIVCKIHGSKNSHQVVRATIDGLKQLVPIEDYARDRGRDVADVFQQRRDRTKKSVLQVEREREAKGQ